MRGLNGKNVLLALNVVALVAIFEYGIQKFALPFIAIKIYGDNYKELVFKCDSVMRDHFIAKNQVLTNPSETSIKNLKAAEIGLLTCHGYDVLRKKLIDFGVTENQLA